MHKHVQYMYSFMGETKIIFISHRSKKVDMPGTESKLPNGTTREFW